MWIYVDIYIYIYIWIYVDVWRIIGQLYRIREGIMNIYETVNRMGVFVLPNSS
jgi:hypothetical protein